MSTLQDFVKSVALYNSHRENAQRLRARGKMWAAEEFERLAEKEHAKTLGFDTWLDTLT